MLYPKINKRITTNKRKLNPTAMLFFCLILFGCANESAPQGGKKDTTPPKAKRISPPDKSLRFTGEQIKITFNEYIKATGFSQTLVSPPMEKQPLFKISGKTLLVKFRSPLRDSTTYTINFADDIKDVNEGNIASNFTYVFSTGSYLDSQKISGTVLLAKDNTTVEGTVVSLYNADTIDGIKNYKPLYFTKADKSGNYTISNIKAGRYTVYALKDNNYNYKYDQPGELIAFNDSIINLSDYFVKKQDLYLFDENKKKLHLDDYRSISPGYIRLCYNKPLESVKINSSASTVNDFAFLNATNDTVSYWFSNYYNKKDTVWVTVNDTLFDTIRIELKNIPKDSLYNNPVYLLSTVNQVSTTKNKADAKTITDVQELNKPLKINLSRPVMEINTLKHIQILDDSADKYIEPDFALDEKSKLSLSCSFEKKENTLYTVSIPDSTLKDIYGMWNRKITYKFTTNGKDNYGNFHLTLKTDHPENYYVIKLLNSNNEEVRQFFFSGNGERKINIENMAAGGYKFVVIDDVNKNGKWDTGDFSKKIQPEKIFSYKETYQLKGGWDLDVEVKF
jgi:uncharacterized protein (DUF2141 family)